jgi:hypothetical protein
VAYECLVGYDILVVAAGIFGLVSGVIGLTIFWFFQSRDRDVLSSTWSEYATAHALEFVAPKGEWPNRTLPRVAWTEDDAAWRLEAVAAGERVRTRLVVRPHEALLGQLRCDVEITGLRDIDEKPAGFAARVLDPALERAMLGFLQRDTAELAYAAGNLTLEWSGGELNDARIDHARSVLRQAAANLARAHAGNAAEPQLSESPA